MRIARGTTFAVADAAGDAGEGHEGFFWRDTRVLSRWRLTLDGAALEPLDAAAVEHVAAQVVLVPRRGGRFDAAPLSILRRRLVDDAWLEELVVINHRAAPVTVPLRLDADADFADLFEVKDAAVRPRAVRREPAGGRLVLRHRRDGFARETTILCDAPEAVADEGGLALALALAPHEERRVCVRVVPGGEQHGRRISARAPAGGFEATAQALRADLDAWVARAPALETDWEDLARTYRRGLLDLAALRFRPWPDRPEAVPAAGLPWFMALFGRDALLTSFQALPFLPELATATLRVLADHRGRRRDDARDEAPGRVLHELRFGELSATGELPFAPYYGTADATPLFVVLLEEARRWSGDDALARELEPAARAALAWLGDGWVAPERRAPRGLPNQCWKDSHNSMLCADGTQARGPFACCETQGYAYDARVRGARLAREVWGDPALADRLEAQAARLRARFHEAFWMPGRGAYALALDGEGRQVDSLTSNVGHLLWSGIVDDGPAARLAGHLAGDELASGWGVRTMGRREGGFNPLEYHNGTVWPHDTALCALGLARHGFRAEASHLAASLVEAAARFGHRLPEVFAGYPRALTGVPVRFPTASSPQAWAAGTPLLLLRVVLGLEPGADGPRADPRLPPPVSRLALRGVPGHWGRADVVA